MSDGFVEKFGSNPVVYTLTEKGKNFDIEKYKGKSLFVTRENAVELEEDEYYIGDLIGMEVYTDDSEERFGVLKDVMETGANEVYIITSENHGEVLLPAIHECILDIDVEAKKMKVHLMEGLL